jgi:dipeptidase E
MRDLLLVSTSRVFGSGYLDHCEAQIRQLFLGLQRVVFVPYASAHRDAYTATARERFARMGFKLSSVHETEDPVALIEGADGIFIGGGNTFLLLRDLYSNSLVEAVRERVLAGMPYLGTSAGSNVACPTIKTTNDMPIVYPPTFDSLALVPFNLNPHYLDPEPGSTHMGETRETRIREFHEHNEPPVVGLREGTMLRVQGDAVHLWGEPGGRLFRRGLPAEEIAGETDLSFLLEQSPGRPVPP